MFKKKDDTEWDYSLYNSYRLYKFYYIDNIFGTSHVNKWHDNDILQERHKNNMK